MKKIILISLLSLFYISLIFSQKINTSFQEPIPIRPAEIKSTLVLSDNKILIGGEISFYQNKKVNNLIRLNSDGSLDESFSVNLDDLIKVTHIAAQTNGDVIVLAEKYNGSYNYFNLNYLLLKLSPDGNVISRVDTLISALSLAVQSDDKILVCGGTWSDGFVYRYNSDLTADTTFNATVSVNDMVNFVTVDSNNIYLSGYFSIVNGITKNDIVKLNFDGSIDKSFDTGTGTDNNINSLSIEKNGKILIGGACLQSYNGNQFLPNPLRLNADGTIDNTFGLYNSICPVSKIFIKDTSYYFGAWLNLSPTEYGDYIVRLKSDGSFDSAFKPVNLDLFGSQQFCIGFIGNDIVYNNSSRLGNKYGLSKCISTGMLDSTFAPEVGRYGKINACDFFCGNLIIAGDFIKINETETFGLARLDNAGKVDSTFVLSEQKGIVHQIKILSANDILISTWEKFFKINKNAEIQSNFNFSFFKNIFQVIKFKPLKDGKIIVADYNHLYRINEDGSEDETFSYGDDIYTGGSPFDFDFQGDKVIYGTSLTDINNSFSKFLVRLNTDGSFDETFNIGTGPDSTVFIVKELANGEILVGGFFKTFNGVEIPHGLVKLSKDGAIDSAFLENQKAIGWFNVSNYIFNHRIIQWGNKIIMNGIYYIDALNTDGTIATDFNIPFSISRLEDFITYVDTLPNEGQSIAYDYKNTQNSNNNQLIQSRVKSETLLTEDSSITIYTYLYTLGTFLKSNSSSPSFLLKLDLDETNQSTTSINEPVTTNADQINIYPNPSNGYVKISAVESINEININIFDLSGRIVLKDKFHQLYEGSIVELNLEDFTPGLYLIKVTTENGNVMIKMLQKI